MSSNSRKMRPTLIRVEKVTSNSIVVILPVWNLRTQVIIPMSQLPDNLRPLIKADTHLVAHVNLDVGVAHKLRFKRFELAPEPDPYDGLA